MKYLVYPSGELVKLGKVRNPNMWLGNAWRYCPGCKQYTYVYAMSTPGQSDCYEVCRECDSHYTMNEVK